MDSSLHEVWQAAAGSPFLPTVGKNSQFLVAFILMLLGLAITGVFTLSLSIICQSCWSFYDANEPTDRSLVNLATLGIPASLALAYVCILR